MSEEALDPVVIIETAMGIERRGRDFYNEAAARASDENAKRMFSNLADDEIQHEAHLQRMLKSLQGTFPQLTEKATAGDLKAHFANQLFPEDPPAAMPDAARTTELEALERGVQLERQSIALYEDAADKADSPGVSNAFRRLVAEERAHLLILTWRQDLLRQRR